MEEWINGFNFGTSIVHWFAPFLRHCGWYIRLSHVWIPFEAIGGEKNELNRWQGHWFNNPYLSCLCWNCELQSFLLSYWEVPTYSKPNQPTKETCRVIFTMIILGNLIVCSKNDNKSRSSKASLSIFVLRIRPRFFLKNGPFPASFSLFSSFQYSWQEMLNIIFCRRLESNCGPLESEAIDIL